MSNLISVFPIPSGEATRLSPPSEPNTLKGDERSFSEWLEESCRDSSRQSNKENAPSPSNPQSPSSTDGTTVATTDAEQVVPNAPDIEETAPVECLPSFPVLVFTDQTEEPELESPTGDSLEVALLETEETNTRILNPLLTISTPPPANSESQPQAPDSSTVIQKPVETAVATPETIEKPSMETKSPPSVPPSAPQLAPSEDKAPPMEQPVPPPSPSLSPSSATSSPPEAPSTTPQPDVDVATLSGVAPSPTQAPENTPLPDWTSEVADEMMESPAQEMAAPVAVAAPPPPSSTTTPLTSEAAVVTENAESHAVQVPEADSSEGFANEKESRSFQSYEETRIHSAVQPPPSAETSETLATAAPLSSSPRPAEGGPLPSFMQPATLAQNLDRIVLHSIRSDSNSIRIELEPVSLGRVTLQCRETSEGLSVEIHVQNNQIRSLLSDQEQDLRNSLESQGMQMGKFSVTCRDGEGRSDGDRPPQQKDTDSPDLEGRQVETKPTSGTSGAERGARLGIRNRWVA